MDKLSITQPQDCTTHAEPLINGFSNCDFSSAQARDRLAQQSSDTVSRSDYINVDNIWEHGVSGRPTMMPVFNSEGDLGSGVIRYPLPSTDKGASEVPGEVTLQDLNQKIVAKAVANVEKTMTPKEKEELAKDSEQYAKDMKEWKQSFVTFIGMNPPKPPAEPESLRRYEQAVDREVDKITKGVRDRI
jgi:hypothetical protein